MFYEKITELSAKKGMSVARMAKELGLSNATATMYSTLLDPHTLTEVMRHTNLEMTQHYKHTKAADILHEVNLGIKKEQS